MNDLAESPSTAVAPAAPVLIVDDNPGKRLALKAILQPLGFSIVEADSGLAALRCVMAQDFAVILLDVCMPSMDGFETVALIRKRRQSEMTPVIFITAYKSDEITDADRYAGGAVDFISTPIRPDELRGKVSAFTRLFLRSQELARQAVEVQASADQLRLLTDAAPIGIFRTDAENRYVYTNPQWSEITGVPAEAAAGERWDTILGSGEGIGLIARLSEGDDQHEADHRFEVRLPGATPKIVLVTSKPISAMGGEGAGWVGTLADVTAEAGAKAAMAEARDEATAASQLKSDFLANMSHEIRTPMNGVIGMTDLLLETYLDTRQREYAQTVRNSGEALMTIIDDILDFSKVEAGKLVVEDVSFDLRAIVNGVARLLAGPAQDKGLEMVVAVGRDVPTLVSGDPGRVRQVLTNLVGNAIKFTHEGEVVVRVSVADSAAEHGMLRFDVSDTGDGIAPEKVGTVFEPFVQADTSTTRKYGGTGLGLSISCQLVTLMGGECGVSSLLGSGSAFWFTIRVGAIADAGPPAPAIGFEDVASTVLVVDDNATQRGLLGDHLQDIGMTVSAATSGPAAIEALRAAAERGSPFDVAFIDESMPGMDGFGVRNAVLAEPALATRMVLMTGMRLQSPAGILTDPGFCAVLPKPARLEDLRSCLGVALRLVPPLSTAEANGHALKAAGTALPETGRLLLAEDNPINQLVAVAMLSSAGYRVDTVLDGTAAVEAAGARSYDAILMDCQMPEMNGYEATAAIRALEGADRHTPIIALTAGARREDRERCLAEGMDAYLAKPVSKDALLALVALSVGSPEAADAVPLPAEAPAAAL